MDIESFAKALPYFELFPQWAKSVILSSFVVCAVSLIIMLVTIAAAYSSGRPKVSITKPAPDAPVSSGFPVEAKVQNIPKDSELWVMTSANKKYWPQERIVQGIGDTWVSRVRNIGGEPGSKQTFGVYLVGEHGQALIELWKRGSSQITNFKDFEIRLTSDIKLLDERQVEVASGEPAK